MQYRILGPLEVLGDDGPLPLGGAKQRALLALLLLQAGRVVSRERLIDELWGDAPPETARATVQVYVSRLRKLLPSNALVTRGAGYALEVEPRDVDLALFEHLRGEGRFHEALALWRGPPLAEFEEEFAHLERARFEELRLATLEERLDADLARGRHVIVGHVGGAGRLDYRALGDPINSAKRLEDANRHLGTHVCVDAATAARAPGFVGRRVGRLVLAGKRQPVEAWEALHRDDVAREWIRACEEAYERMANEDPQALALYRALERERPDDALVRLHRKRLEAGEVGPVVRLSRTFGEPEPQTQFLPTTHPKHSAIARSR